MRDYVPMAWDDPSYKEFVLGFYNYHMPETLRFDFKELFSEMTEDKFTLRDNVFRHLLDQLGPGKSPGSPLCFLGPTNDRIEINFTSELREELEHRIAGYTALGKAVWNLKGSPEFEEWVNPTDRSRHASIATEMLTNNITDPSLIKVKNEARKIGKIPRLVNMVSSVTNTCWRIALGDAMMHEQTLDNLPIATALDLVTMEKTNEMFDLFVKHAPISTTDVQGWEYANRPYTHFRPFLKWCYVMELTDINLNPLPTASLEHFYFLFGLYLGDLYRVLETEDGELVTTPPGEVTSGGLTTFTDGSCKRASLSSDAAKDSGVPLTFVKTAGDDCMDSNGDCAEFYRRRGFVTTDFAIQHDQFSFCSTRFVKDASYGENIEKFYANMMLKNEDSTWNEQVLGFHTCFSNHPDYDRFWKMIVRDSPSQVTEGN